MSSVGSASSQLLTPRNPMPSTTPAISRPCHRLTHDVGRPRWTATRRNWMNGTMALAYGIHHPPHARPGDTRAPPARAWRAVRSDQMHRTMVAASDQQHHDHSHRADEVVSVVEAAPIEPEPSTACRTRLAHGEGDGEAGQGDRRATRTGSRSPDATRPCRSVARPPPASRAAHRVAGAARTPAPMRRAAAQASDHCLVAAAEAGASTTRVRACHASSVGRRRNPGPTPSDGRGRGSGSGSCAGCRRRRAGPRTPRPSPRPTWRGASP